MTDIIRWISNFKDAKKTFTEGCCYWFAYILQQRYGGEIWYDNIIGHFVCKIEGTYYDVTGVYEPENIDWLESWSSIQQTEPERAQRITKHCIDMQ